MKKPTIRVSGKQVFANQDELEKGYVEIELEAYDILREIDADDVADYARWSLDMKHEDDFKSSLDDFSEDELVKALESNGYNFAQKVTEEDCIEVLEENGYIISTEKENVLDHIDAPMFEEIQEKFLNANWAERQDMYNLIKNI